MAVTLSTRTLAEACLVTVLAGCGDQTAAPEFAGPPLNAVASVTGLPVYGIGSLVRAVPRPCQDPATGAFDFWIGNWRVERAGTNIGTDIVTRELDACVVMEDWIASGGSAARSMSVYEAATGQWHQVYQDNLLGNFRLSGVAGPGSMELNGSQRIFHFGLGTFVDRDAASTWTDLGDGTVRQLILGSFDGGAIQTLFDAAFVPEADLDRADPAFFPFCQNVLPGFRELDFWIGSWKVAAAHGPDLGTAEVFSDLNGCLIQHDFSGVSGYRSRSFLMWDFATGRWFRTLADNLGGYVQLSGELVGGSVVLGGTYLAPDGSEVRLRNILSQDQGGVLESWEVSRDGETWVSSLEARYTSQ